MLKLSIGYKTLILGPTSFTQIFNGGVIKVYGGVRPVNAENAPDPTQLLGVVGVAGSDAGLFFTQTGAYMTPALGVIFQLTVINAGTPTWFRLETATDSGGASFTDARIDGDVGTSSTMQELTLATATLVQGTSVNLDTFIFTIAPLPGS